MSVRGESSSLSLPICAGTLWSLRALAPTHLIVAGAVAGFASGALGAWIYAFHCDESAMPFVLIFYTLGIALVGATGPPWRAAFCAGDQRLRARGAVPWVCRK